MLNGQSGWFAGIAVAKSEYDVVRPLFPGTEAADRDDVWQLLAFVAVVALKRAGLWPLEINARSLNSVRDLCLPLGKDGGTTAFSPLVRARGGLAAESDAGSARPLPHV
jgi:hypothetical protein